VTSSPAAVMWFRRDLRLLDNPALAAASKQGPVLPLFVLDSALLRPAGAPRVAFLARALRALDEDLKRYGGRLTVRAGSPEEVVPQVAREIGAASVHASEDFGPYGAARDRRVGAALGPVPLMKTGSAYAVRPGKLANGAGQPYRVYSAFSRAWYAHGHPPPAASDPAAVRWAPFLGQDVLAEPTVGGRLPVLPEPGEQAALAAWRRFRDGALARYADERDRPGLEGTSRLSAYLKWGMVHPRTLLAELRRWAPGSPPRQHGPASGTGEARRRAAERFRAELVWREFYASVLAAWPESARAAFRGRFANSLWDNDPVRWKAWAEGRTGYPLVDAGMRQLLAEAWMHNRVRMVTASFLVKDLHQDWRRGARHFMAHLVDADLASNQHGWQWTAGTGTDAARYHRVLNPVTQAKRFDPDGTYVRRWVPELRGLEERWLFEPWRAPGGPPSGYPMPVVDHSIERERSLGQLVAWSRGKLVR
jgi:deoxyribodipyrimidine photo-lyase